MLPVSSDMWDHHYRSNMLQPHANDRTDVVELDFRMVGTHWSNGTDSIETPMSLPSSIQELSL